MNRQLNLNRPPHLFVLLTGILLVWIPTVSAGIKLPAVLGDHMVLQQSMKVPIWG